MMKTSVLIAVALLTTACAGPRPIRVQPGTDMALPDPAPSPAGEVIAGLFCVATRYDNGDVPSCPQRTDSLRVVNRPPVAVSKPQMRVRTTTSVFRRG